MPIATEAFQIRRNAAVPRITRYSWTVEQLKLLCALVESGESSARASVMLKRPRRSPEQGKTIGTAIRGF
jgi:hypothetical protein